MLTFREPLFDPWKAQTMRRAEDITDHPSDRLWFAIGRSGLSFYALGKRARIDPSIISRFRRGKRGLTVKTFDALADALGLELVRVRERRGDDVPVDIGPDAVVSTEEQGKNRVPADS
jgi:transcriptional regulator with XRE-family HTH domain